MTFLDAPPPGHPDRPSRVRSEYKRLEDPDVLPPPDTVMVAPQPSTPSTK